MSSKGSARGPGSQYLHQGNKTLPLEILLTPSFVRNCSWGRTSGLTHPWSCWSFPHYQCPCVSCISHVEEGLCCQELFQWRLFQPRTSFHPEAPGTCLWAGLLWAQAPVCPSWHTRQGQNWKHLWDTLPNHNVPCFVVGWRERRENSNGNATSKKKTVASDYLATVCCSPASYKSCHCFLPDSHLPVKYITEKYPNKDIFCTRG